MFFPSFSMCPRMAGSMIIDSQARRDFWEIYEHSSAAIACPCGGGGAAAAARAPPPKILKVCLACFDGTPDVSWAALRISGCSWNAASVWLIVWSALRIFVYLETYYLDQQIKNKIVPSPLGQLFAKQSVLRNPGILCRLESYCNRSGPTAHHEEVLL